MVPELPDLQHPFSPTVEVAESDAGDEAGTELVELPGPGLLVMVNTGLQQLQWRWTGLRLMNCTVEFEEPSPGESNCRPRVAAGQGRSRKAA